MMDYVTPENLDKFAPYHVYSRREIISIMNRVMDTRQLVRMVFNNGYETIVTNILDVDADSGKVIVDCGKDRGQNQRIVDSGDISFETTLERIRVLFFSKKIDTCQHEGRPALCFDIPELLVRLQRRESYRVHALGVPVRFSYETELGAVETTLYLRDISSGGAGLTDHEMILDNTVGKVYEKCKMCLTEQMVLDVSLEIRNSQELTAPNGKNFRRIGCKFVGLPNRTLMSLQRYITQLERDHNAKATGMA